MSTSHLKIYKVTEVHKFKKEVRRFFNRWKIKRACTPAYHSQSQGIVKRSHRELKNKIRLDMVKLNQKMLLGLNWPHYATILNEGMREELGWKSPFEIYCGRKSNAILNEQWDSLSNNETKVTKTRLSNENDITGHRQILADYEYNSVLKIKV